MADGHNKAAWGRTASLMALLASINTGKAHAAAEFNPYARRQRIVQGDISILGKLFCRR